MEESDTTRAFIVSDPDKCTGCGICELVCSAKKERVFNSELSRVRLVRIEPVLTMSMSCRLCEKSPCVNNCPKQALRQDEETGVIMVDEHKCIGCGWCLQPAVCQFGALGLNTTKKSVFVCDLCEGEPICVKLCPREALESTTAETLSERIKSSAVKKLFQEIPSARTF